ncbi:hypothetical protein [uncultured Flavobacterium sp.]|uniref:hypothetical protein n=1 Tax=uncultured Flavobacterium sp. TaxID=165435 RepID=UPI0025D1E976|nr:hypothetical protein [uncultured Flavobacterium sp.]
MKKIFAILVLFLAFSINANAQNTAHDEAVKDVAALKTVVKIEASSNQVFESIFYDKHKFLLQSNLTEEMKQEKFRNTEERLAAALEPAQLEKLRANAELYKKLTR